LNETQGTNAAPPAPTTIEEEIQRLRLTAPRITPDHIDSVIFNKRFVQPTHTMLTLCVLTLRNGFNVVGESACVSRDNFNVELGQRIALEDAKKKILVLEGYLLAERLHAEALRNARVNAQQGFEAQGQSAGVPK
jgi:hypothetical protein